MGERTLKSTAIDRSIKIKADRYVKIKAGKVPTCLRRSKPLRTNSLQLRGIANIKRESPARLACQPTT
jgi:hypothetical protein